MDKKGNEFYNENWFMWIMLIFVAPVGIFLLWRNKKYENYIKIIVTVIFVSIMLFSLLGISEVNSENEINAVDPVNEISESTENNIAEDVSNDVEEVREIEDVNYVALWNDYEKKDSDKYVRFSGRIDSISNNSISIKDGLEGITGNLYISFADIKQIEELKYGDYVTIVGETGTKLMGQLHIENAVVEEKGDSSKEQVAKYEQNTNELIAKQEQESKEQAIEDKKSYIKKAKSISYNDLIREPYKYKGEIITVKVEIAQVMPEGILTEEAYRGYQEDNEWYLSYKIPENTPRILEGDVVTIYGEFDELTTIKRTLTGAKDNVPRIKVKYYE